MAFTLVMKTSGKGSLHEFFCQSSPITCFFTDQWHYCMKQFDQKNLSKAV